MPTRPWTDDSRLLLLMLAADDAAEKPVGSLGALAHRPVRRGRLSQYLRKFEATGLITRDVAGAGDPPLLRITERGRRSVLGSVDPVALWARPWDGKWRMTMFDIPQVHAALRTRLRRKLRELRFGWLQNSVWLSPDPLPHVVELFSRDRAAVDSLLFLEARPIGGESDADLVAVAWDFETLTRLHAAYLKLVRTRPPAGRAGKPADWAAWLATEQAAWREILRVDPFLPESLLPRDYAGPAIWQARVDALRSAGRALAELAVSE